MIDASYRTYSTSVGSPIVLVEFPVARVDGFQRGQQGGVAAAVVSGNCRLGCPAAEVAEALDLGMDIRPQPIGQDGEDALDSARVRILVHRDDPAG